MLRYMNIATFFAVAFAAIAILIMFVIPAFASEAADTYLSLGGLIDAVRPVVLELAGVIVAALIGYVSVTLNRALGINIEAKHRDALQSALINGIGAGIAKLRAPADNIGIDVKSEVIADGIRYVKGTVPDAIRFFGLTDERLRELLEAKLGLADDFDAVEALDG